MLNFVRPEQLANAVGFDLPTVSDVLHKKDCYLRHFLIRRPDGKTRKVVSALPPLYHIQRYFLQNVLRPNFQPSIESHGGIVKRSIKTNAAAHSRQRFAYTTDVSDFFPSIHYNRVAAWFERVGCSSAVAGMCACICTADNRLQQGLMTSPFIADQLMKPVDVQIASMCRKQKRPLVYTRYVDDISVSGPFDLQKSRIPHLVRRILKHNGFRAKIEKEQFGTLRDGVAITKVRIRKGGRLDVTREYAAEVDKLLRQHITLSNGGEFTGTFLTEAQLWGKVSFVCWVNPGRAPELLSLLKRIDWDQAFENAHARGLLNLFTPQR